MIVYTSEDLDTLGRTIWGEARGEPKEGREAVAWVIRNRLNRPKRFARTIAKVCKQPYQFSCWNKADPNLPKMLALTDRDKAFQGCLEAATTVLESDGPDPTLGSQFYHTAAVAPNWARGKQPAVKIGAHLFFNDVA